MDYIYTQIKNVLASYELNYQFDEANVNYQFSVGVEIGGFYDDMMMTIYVNESELNFTLVVEKLILTEEVYHLMNNWNSDSLLLKVYADDEDYLVIESYHNCVSQDHFQPLLIDILDVTTKEVIYYREITDYFDDANDEGIL